MIWRSVMGLVMAAACAVSAMAAEPAALQPSASSLPAIQAPVIVAQDASCANACQSEHDRCRVQTKGSPSCDGARQRCLQACIASKRK